MQFFLCLSFSIFRSKLVDGPTTRRVTVTGRGSWEQKKLTLLAQGGFGDDAFDDNALVDGDDDDTDATFCCWCWLMTRWEITQSANFSEDFKFDAWLDHSEYPDVPAVSTNNMVSAYLNKLFKSISKDVSMQTITKIWFHFRSRPRLCSSKKLATLTQKQILKSSSRTSRGWLSYCI